MDIDNFDTLMRASLMERIIGTVTADITASDVKNIEQQRKKINYLYKLFDSLKFEVN
ncbi:MAG: hypothetical protein ABEJ24_05930 [Candidatus Magasanikbacteria bacterium]